MKNGFYYWITRSRELGTYLLYFENSDCDTFTIFFFAALLFENHVFGFWMAKLPIFDLKKVCRKKYVLCENSVEVKGRDGSHFNNLAFFCCLSKYT